MTFPRPKFVQAVKKGDATLLYFRKAGAPRARLTSPDGSWSLLWEAFGHFIASTMAPKAEPTPRSFAAYIKAYENGAEFGRLTPRVQRNYRSWLRAFAADLGELDVQDFTPSFIIALRDTWAHRGYEAANTGLKILKPIIDRARIAGAIEGDPLSLVAKVERPHAMGEAHPIWTDEEVWAAIDDCIARDRPGLARAIALGRFGGFRRQSICSIPRSARVMVTNADGGLERRVTWITEKKKVLADKREDARLTDVLRRTPDRALKIAYNADGDPWKERQLNQALTRAMDRLAAAGRVRSYVDEKGKVRCPLTFHGLRHARGVEIADAGGSDAEIMAQIDHASPRAAAIYRRQAERRKLSDSGQDKVDNVVSIKAERARKASAGKP